MFHVYADDARSYAAVWSHIHQHRVTTFTTNFTDLILQPDDDGKSEATFITLKVFFFLSFVVNLNIFQLTFKLP